ncbi:SDR family oxidoreductase [Salinimicrobium sediminilitoris]|uniref:SDR family oxidoreductase n=1 Tax=Salinimicrobium sediminilitoris TaxID=2876715 RepID=UPI001E3C39B8|nr:SDR family oxidoreductase [Salinimicrobium sediminilitoris]MCC8360188.1 SDR family oxidoreductase [Salinimicrobium sediminilitoris]
MKKENVLVAGANGTTGRIIVDLLKESNKYKPVALVRKKEQKEDFESNNVSAILADLEEDLSSTTENVQKVIFAAGSKGKNVKGVDQEGAKKLTDAAKKSGASKFVMLSSMGADNPSVNEEMQDYLQAKQNADEHLKSSGIAYSIVRPGSLNNNDGSGKIKLEKKFDDFGEIPRADVAKTLVEVLDDNVRHNEVFEILSGDTEIEKAVRS